MNNFNNNSYLNMELLRFTTAGSVDDGKSTLIGRLLYDSKSIFEDQYEAIKLASERRGEDSVNLALLTDGLKAEREQGITIDVAYRYFATPKRKFIIADTPGHIQYTRNMVTGASTANLAIVLVDARKGVIEQTKRHTFIASLLGIKHLVLCINKMDLVNWDKTIFEQIKLDFKTITAKIEINDIHFIPISALKGDNIIHKSENMNWYKDYTLMELLENIEITNDNNFTDGRFPIQSVIRPQNDEFHDYRGYAGRVASGIFKIGDEVTVLPSKLPSKIKSIDLYNQQIEEAFPPMSVTIRLEDEIDISRGDMIVHSDNLPEINQEIEVMLCWMNENKMEQNGKYLLKHTTKECKCIVKEVKSKLDVHTFEELCDNKEVCLNDITRISIKTMLPLFYDKYKANKFTGSIILIDEKTNETVAAGMIV